MFDDIAWLGKEDAYLGPFARAGLGVLMRAENWTWWYFPDEIEEHLARLAKSGIVTWGADSRLLTSNHWLDTDKALKIADAFRKALYENPWLRLKISRDVWTWGATSLVAEVRADLSQAIDNSHIFLDWPVVRRPTRKVVSPWEIPQLIISGPAEMRIAGTALAVVLPKARWEDDAYRADIYIGSVKDYQTRKIAADVAIIVEYSAGSALEILDQLRFNGTRSAIRFGGPETGLVPWIEEFGKRWQFESIDDAVAVRSPLSLIVEAEILASNHAFIRQTVDLFDKEREVNSIARRAYGGRSQAPYILKELVELPKKLPAPTSRVIDATVRAAGRPTKKLPVDQPVQISISIVYNSLMGSNHTAFPEHLITWESDSKVLNVHMLELDSPSVAGQIRLPKTGVSTSANFEYFVKKNTKIDLRFVVADGVRIVQTARLKGDAGEDFTFAIESANDTLQHEKKGFDLALLVNDSLGNKSSATVLTKEGVTIKVLQSNALGQARDVLLETITKAVTRTKGDHVTTYFELANLGKMLFDGLKASTPGWPDKLDRIQLTTQADAYFPLEYLFDGEMPDDDSAGLCPERKSCLSNGVAKSPCAIRDTAQHLCPMNFVGVSALIERQTWTEDMPVYPWMKLPDALTGRKKINNLNNVVFGASDSANDFNESDVALGVVPVRTEQIAEALGSSVITAWPDWVAAIKSEPNLLVLVPHIEDGKLFIGDQNGLYFGAIKPLHIGQGNPVVIALGCTSGLGPLAFIGLPSILKEKGAISVIAALTEILGRYANIVTLKLAKDLQAAALAATPTSIGEIVSRMRRDLLSYDLATGLVVIAFGDADYALGGQTNLVHLPN